MKIFCLFGIHFYKYSVPYQGSPNGLLGTYKVQDGVCPCCSKVKIKMCGNMI